MENVFQRNDGDRLDRGRVGRERDFCEETLGDESGEQGLCFGRVCRIVRRGYGFLGDKSMYDSDFRIKGRCRGKQERNKIFEGVSLRRFVQVWEGLNLGCVCVVVVEAMRRRYFRCKRNLVFCLSWIFVVLVVYLFIWILFRISFQDFLIVVQRLL